MPDNQKHSLITRRDAVKLAAAGAAAILFPSLRDALGAESPKKAKAKSKTKPKAKAGATAPGGDKDVPPGEQVIPEDNGMAKALGYRKDANQVDTKVWIKRAAPDGKTQFCDNCVFYSKVNDHWGACSVLGAGVVAAKGWCSNWAKKPE